MRTVILIFSIILLVSCGSFKKALPIDKTTNYFHSKEGNKASVLREIFIDVDSLKNMLIVVDDKYFVKMGNNLEFFKEVKTDEQLFTAVSNSGLAKKIPNLKSNEGLYKLAQLYPSFVMLDISSDRKSNGDTYAILTLYYPKIGYVIFRSEIYVNLMWDGWTDRATLNPLFNSLLDYLRKQKKAKDFLRNDGIVTYFEKYYETNFAVSFIGDSVINSTEYSDFYSIDGSVVQFTNYPIPYDMKDYMFDSIKEYKLLDRIRDYELENVEEKVFKQKVESHSEYFTNQYQKKFLLWYFKQPDSIPDLKKDTSENLDREKYEFMATYEIDYLLNLMFTSNNRIVAITYPVFKQENLSFRLDYLKNEVANSVRVYNMNIDTDFLTKQIEHNINKKPLIVKDTFVGIQYEVPYWLNVNEQPSWLRNYNENKHSLFGTFPDIWNISNAVALYFHDKSKYKSLKEYEDSCLINKESIIKYDKISGPEEKFVRYKIEKKTEEGYEFRIQYVFFEVGNYYGCIDFTATPETYDKNIDRFNEFLKSVIILK